MLVLNQNTGEGSNVCDRQKGSRIKSYTLSNQQIQIMAIFSLQTTLQCSDLF